MSNQFLIDMPPRSDALTEKRRVTYHRLPCRTVLNRNPNAFHSFYWTINPYRGCEIGCTYCYARYTHSFMELDDPFDFERRIYAKVDAPQVLATTVDPADLRGKPVAIGTATDPYQPAERRFRITRHILEILLRYPTLELSITTKSDLVLRDLDVLTALAERRELVVHLTLTTVDPALSRRLEPGAPTPGKRLETVAALQAAGIRTGVFVMPVLPRITDGEVQLDRLFRAVSAAGAEFASCALLTLREIPKRRFFPFLAQAFPEHLDWYLRAYGHTSTLRGAAARRIRTRVGRLKRRHRVRSRPEALPPRAVDEQLELRW